MAWVWPPQTSISVHGRVAIAGDRGGEAAGGVGVAILVEELHCALRLAPSSASMLADPLEMREDAAGLGLVDDGDGEADMDEHVVADLGLGRVGEVDLLDDAAEIDARRCA